MLGVHYGKLEGEYIIKVVYGEDNIAETLFNYTPKSEILEITDEIWK